MKLIPVIVVIAAISSILFVPTLQVDAKEKIQPELVFFSLFVQGNTGQSTGSFGYHNPSTTESFDLDFITVKLNDPDDGNLAISKQLNFGGNTALGPNEFQLIEVPFENKNGKFIVPQTPFKVELEGENSNTKEPFSALDKVNCNTGTIICD